jgi:hypothetical protein
MQTVWEILADARLAHARLTVSGRVVGFVSMSRDPQWVRWIGTPMHGESRWFLNEADARAYVETFAEAERLLITCDGAGKTAKAAAQASVIRRAIA